MAVFTYTAPTVGGSSDTWGATLNTNWSNLSTFLGSLDSAELAVLDGITADTAELNLLDGVTATTAELNVLAGVTADTAELNLLDGVTATTDELNYVSGVTSAIQTQLDAVATVQDEADWEAGTSTTESVVSPAKVKAAIESAAPLTTTSGAAPYFAARAFVFIEDGSDAANTYHGQNIASVVRDSTGLYTITFTTAMPDANYAVSAHGGSQASPNTGLGMSVGFTAKSPSSFTVKTLRPTNRDIFDCDQLSFVVFA